MSDITLLGVLRMPVALWDTEGDVFTALDAEQRRARYVEAANRIEADAKRIADLERERDNALRLLAEAEERIEGLEACANSLYMDVLALGGSDG